MTKRPAAADDSAYRFANALYHQSRRNRIRGCNKETLRRLLALNPGEAGDLTNALVTRGWATEQGDGISLTPDGWNLVLDLRRDKTHATVRFVTTAEFGSGHETRAYQFGYLLRDNMGRQFSHQVIVSVSDELCRHWKLRDFQRSLDEARLVTLLRRFAFDHVADCVVKHNLNDSERLHLGGALANRPCRYDSNNLPESEQEEHEVEWSLDPRH